MTSCNVQNESDGEFYTPAPALASSRYNRQMLVPAISVKGQEKICSARVLIIGLGGLGAPAALYLAGAGVGTIGFLDNDQVETSNLHRQIVHRESSVHEQLSKVQSAIKSCSELNSEPRLIAHEFRLDVLTAEKTKEVISIFEQYDLVLDCTDNPATRYLISDLCVITSRVLVSGAAQRLEGQITVLNYDLPSGDRGPCYRCVFPTPPSPEMVKGCSEIGILGPVVGTIGTLMASEALRLIVRGQESRKPSMLMYNAWPTDPRMMFRNFGIRGQRQDCISCGNAEHLRGIGKVKISRDELISGHIDYINFCGSAGQINMLPPERRICASDVMEMTRKCSNQQKANDMLVVDTREPEEVEMGAKLNTGINIPFSQLQRQSAMGNLDEILDSRNPNSVVFICQRGNDSQIAARKLEEYRKSRAPNENVAHSGAKELFIGDVKDGFVGLQKWYAAK